MVGLWPTRCLQAQRVRTEPGNRRCSRNPIYAPAPNLANPQRGWMSERNLPGSRETCFFLTSPFIEPGKGDNIFQHGRHSPAVELTRMTQFYPRPCCLAVVGPPKKGSAFHPSHITDLVQRVNLIPIIILHPHH